MTADQQQPAAGQPNCFHCRHFYITYEPAHPNGCRAMGFKSRQTPSLAVYASSGMVCQLFEGKKK